MLLCNILIGISARETICNACSETLEKVIESDKMHKGITATAGGFTDRKVEFFLEYSR
jgi:hypothetical protein